MTQIEKSPEKVKLMQEAVDLSAKALEIGGGPFGAVIVKDGKVVGRGNNLVTVNNDPTAHAEVSAIRDACRNLKTFDLSGCDLYTSCEPCPMCLSAAMWARVETIYYANDRYDAAKIGFDDEAFYKQFVIPVEEREIPMIRVEGTTALDVFNAWEQKADKTEY